MTSPDPETSRLFHDLDRALEQSLQPVLNGTEALAVLYSGGIDSSLLAWELRRRPELTLCTVGRPGSPDLLAGQRGAGLLDLPWRGIAIDGGDVHDASLRFVEELGGVPWVVRTVLLSLALAIERAPADTLVCGQGADELFLGYAHYAGMSSAEAEIRVRADLDRLLAVDWPRTRRIAERTGKEIVAPFLAPGFIESALSVPIARRLPATNPKRLFREWSILRGVPAELAGRRKRAIQYGTGVAALASAAERPTR